MEFAGYLASAFAGLTLGLTGGGGSIITVPILVYLFHIEPVLATRYSLFIVGVTSLVGGIRSAQGGLVNFRKAILFSLPAMFAIYFTRHIILPVIPENIIATGAIIVTRDLALMTFFTLTMLIVSLRMIRNRNQTHESATASPHSHIKTNLVGLVVGFLSGIIGAGGGFLIIPALVEFEKLTVKQAVGTSLLIIAANSLIGFLGDIGTNDATSIDIGLITVISLLSVGGVFVGGYLARFLTGKKLKFVFGWFTLLITFFIVYKEFVVKFLLV